MATLHPMPSCHSKPTSYDVCDNTRRGSSPSLSDDEDIITPCPLERPSTRPRQEAQGLQVEDYQAPPSSSAHFQKPRPKSWRAEHWYFDRLDSEGDDVDPTALWRAMLSIQRVFGCYNSARMRAALETGDEDAFVPSKTCLDLLNDSIAHLSEDARRQLDDFLNGEGGLPRRSTSSWKHRLLHGPS